MAQFYGQPVNYQDSPADYKGLQDLASNAYDMEQKRNLNKLFSSTVQPDGRIDEVSFYKGVKQYGLNPEAATQALKFHKAQKDAQVSDVLADSTIKSGNRDPQAGGGSDGAPPPAVKTIPTDSSAPQQSQEAPQQSQTVAPQPAPVQTQQAPTEAPKPLTPASFGNYFQQLKSKAAEARQQLGLAPKVTMNADGTTSPAGESPVNPTNTEALAKFLGMTPKTETPKTEEVTAVSTGDGQIEGSANVIANDFVPKKGSFEENPEIMYGFDNKPPVETPAPQSQVPMAAPATQPVDNRSWRQQVEDSEKPASVSGATLSHVSPEDPILQWSPTNIPGQYYQQFASALTAKLKAAGYANSGEYLKQIYDSTLDANTPAAPNDKLLLLGTEGIAKYGEQEKAYEAGAKKAKGLALTAVRDAKEKLAEFANVYGNQITDNESTKIGDNRLRDKTKRVEAAAIVTNKKLIQNIKDDIKKINTISGNDASKSFADYKLLAPQVIRAYATAMNPGQQLNQGNLEEVMKSMYPDLVGTVDFTNILSRAFMRVLLSKNKDAALDTEINKMISGFDAQDPARIKTRLTRILSEAENATNVQYDNYIVGDPTKLKVGDTKSTPNGILTWTQFPDGHFGWTK